MKLIGRQKEKKVLNDVLQSQKAEFVAMYGRRRVGKTYLIETVLSETRTFVFSLTGRKDGTLEEQLFLFSKAISKTFYKDLVPPTFPSWNDAFEGLCTAIEAKVRQNPNQVISLFIDELPWLSTKRSKLLSWLDHYWNTRLVKIRNVKLIVCGSAVSWMLENLVHAKGGLYNRLTRVIRLEPFSLRETQEFFESRNIKFSRMHTLELYMALGGIPHYLDKVQKGYSAQQNIAMLCFQKGGELSEEFEKTFSSLFENSEYYANIISFIASKRYGVSLTDIAKALKIAPGGRLAKRLSELEEAGFIASFTPYLNKSKDTFYRVIDEYSLFYLKWIASAPKKLLASSADGYWEGKSQSPGYHAWAGYSFEGICLKHIEQIRKKLRLSHVPCETGAWRYVSKKNSIEDHGAQIDLLFDRTDGVITICEMKFSDNAFSVDKSFAQKLKSKLQIFEERTQTKKQLSCALVTTHEIKKNTWSEGLIDQIVILDDLFV